MCAIFGSKDKQKFLELAELNQYRGNHSWSTTCFVTGRFEHYANADRVKHILTYRGEGEFEDKVTGFPEDNKDFFFRDNSSAVSKHGYKRPSFLSFSIFIL